MIKIRQYGRRKRPVTQLSDARSDDAVTVGTLASADHEQSGPSIEARDGVIHTLAERMHGEAHRRLKSLVFDKIRDGIAVTDSALTLLLVNDVFTQVTGYTQEEIAGRTPDILFSGRHDKTFFLAVRKVLDESGFWEGEVWNRRKNGEICPEWVAITALRDEHGALTHYLAVFSDITERKLAEERLNYLAQYDILTGLPNRTLFRDRLRQTMSRAHRENEMIALMFLDLDRFKEINEALGLESGDLVLQDVTARLKGILRESDTIARLGADEFSIILEGIASDAEATVVAEKILEIFEQPIMIQDRELFVTASIGIATHSGFSQTEESLIRAADIAMYSAKREGRNCYQLYSQSAHTKSPERLDMESQLRHALERNELVLSYQPRVSVGSGEIVAVEALLRWKSSALGLVAPGAFIPLAEDTGLILPIGDWVLREACRQCRLWMDAGWNIKVAVNLSARQFKHKDLLQATAAAISDSGVAPHLLELELTESILMHHTGGSVAMLKHLSAMGVEIAIDDFGTGYSSLAYLKRFPVHALKIDQSFVRDLPQDAEDAAIVRAIYSLARSLRLKVIAEGVETEAQLAFLRQLNCDEYQGYLFSKPVWAEDMTAMLVDGQAQSGRRAISS